MIGRMLAVVRSRAVRVGFLLVALAAAVFAIADQRAKIVVALQGAQGWMVPAALVASVAYLAATFAAWRAVMRMLGAPLGVADAFGLFFVSQLGKYVPGGVWNVVAAGELGADLRVPRRTSVSAMVVALLISVVSGLAVAAPALLLSSDATAYAWAWLLVPLLAALLVPPVLDRLLRVAMTMLRRDPIDHELSWRGVLVAVAWSLVGWLLAGLQVWLLVVGLGVRPGLTTIGLSIGGYALAWVVGFLFLVVPAGVGVREVVLIAVLGTVASDATVLAVALLSRVLFTVADVAASLTGLRVARLRARLRGEAGAQA